MMQLKEKKEMDDAFKKAQKPWAKLLTKVAHDGGIDVLFCPQRSL